MKRITFFMVLVLSMFSLRSFAQRRELRTESNGFQWYEDITSNGDRSASDVNENVLIPFSRGYDFLCFHPREKTTGYFTVKSKGKSGACDITGKEIVHCKYKTLIYSSYSDCFSYKDDTGNWVDLKIRLDKDGLLIK